MTWRISPWPWRSEVHTSELQSILVLTPSLSSRVSADRALWQASAQEALLKCSGPCIRGLVTSGGVGSDLVLIEALPKLEIISSFGVGYDPIDIDGAKERKVVVTNTPDVLTDDVADIAMALMLAMMRRIPQGDAFVR